MPGLGGIKEFLSRDMLMTAGGAVGGTALTGLVLRQFGPNKIVKDAAGKDIVMPKAAGEFKLPFTQNADLSVNRAGIAFYSVAIPIAGAVALRRFSRELSNGMALSGLVMGINELISYFQSSTAPAAAAKVAGGGAYLDAPTRRRLAVGMNGAGYDAVNAFGGSIYRSESAFKDNAWS